MLLFWQKLTHTLSMTLNPHLPITENIGDQNNFPTRNSDFGYCHLCVYILFSHNVGFTRTTHTHFYLYVQIKARRTAATLFILYAMIAPIP